VSVYGAIHGKLHVNGEVLRVDTPPRFSALHGR